MLSAVSPTTKQLIRRVGSIISMGSASGMHSTIEAKMFDKISLPFTMICTCLGMRGCENTSDSISTAGNVGRLKSSALRFSSNLASKGTETLQRAKMSGGILSNFGCLPSPTDSQVEVFSYACEPSWTYSLAPFHGSLRCANHIGRRKPIQVAPPLSQFSNWRLYSFVVRQEVKRS